MGTGNDLARTLGLPSDPVDAARALVRADRATIDLCRASWRGAERYFVNASVGGFPVKVDEAIDRRTKERLGPVAFLWGGIKAATDLERWTVTVNGTTVEDCVAVGVGNGRTAGGGIEVWPDADPDDGCLDVYALPASNALEALQLGGKVRSGGHAQIDDVTFERSGSVTVEATPAMGFNVDGELVGSRTPVTFEVVGKIWMLKPGA
jgi:diacylglycerol kinase (ATP)